ncbi:MAG: hypothetical protein EOM26_07430 [Alphaproteobacteria bacterium]|nr:hypothetical protein [Alphaproteobacteria bacterium]
MRRAAVPINSDVAGRHCARVGVPVFRGLRIGESVVDFGNAEKIALDDQIGARREYEHLQEDGGKSDTDKRPKFDDADESDRNKQEEHDVAKHWSVEFGGKQLACYE